MSFTLLDWLFTDSIDLEFRSPSHHSGRIEAFIRPVGGFRPAENHKSTSHIASKRGGDCAVHSRDERRLSTTEAPMR